MQRPRRGTAHTPAVSRRATCPRSEHRVEIEFFSSLSRWIVLSLLVGGVAIGALGRDIGDWRFWLEIADGASDGALQFVDRGVVSAVSVVFQEERCAAKYGDKRLG